MEFWGWFGTGFQTEFLKRTFWVGFSDMGWNFDPNSGAGYLFRKMQGIYKHRALAYTYVLQLQKKNCYENSSLIFCRFVHMCSKIYENTCQSGLRKKNPQFLEYK